ncbi:chemotaxis protein CheA [Beijerinckia sp. L45]|uniref:chemotaxis protein CheA n=1 Tax=Beijerinckia sp. L45 TaxID=1641855 RepID=UPI00131D5185|nr:chemotaxis protein CheA [Beijerinckia sp. L45]
MDELLEQFLIEGRELTQQASDDLLALERDPSDAARIDSVFRAVHTLKGSVGLFHFAAMGAVLHVAEDLLGQVRNGHFVADRPVIDALLDCISCSETWIEAIAAAGSLPQGADEDSRRLQSALKATMARDVAVAHAPATTEDPSWLPPFLDRAADAVTVTRAANHALVALRYTPSSDCFFLGDDPMALARAIPGLVAFGLSARDAWDAPTLDPYACNLIIEALSTAPVDDIRAVFRFVADQVVVIEVAPGNVAATSIEQPQGSGEIATRTLRVEAGRIDALVDIVGELIVAKNALAHLAAQVAEKDATLGRALDASQADIARLVGDMHRDVMRVRMVPLAQTFRRFPRLVREIAGKLGKTVNFETVGDDVEADKGIVDGLFEPLLHVLRNAVDHGIEDAATRLAQRKPASGTISLEARRDNGQIVVTVTDDGAGIDPARLRAIAKTRGLMSNAALAALDDTAALDLIFAPGFTTAAAITDISGRGVGMDAVRSKVVALGGRVTIASTLGSGSTIRLSLPQAATVSTVMTVRVGTDRFGIPMETIAETARVATDRIIPIRSGEAFVLRDATIPLVSLASLLNVAGAPRATDVKLLIVASGDQRIGIEVDGFAERIDVLLRPMTGLLSGMTGVLGTALLGDGRVMMILDLPELLG